MKKYISIILAVIMIFSTASVFAAQKTKVNDLEINIPDNFYLADKDVQEGGTAIIYNNSVYDHESLLIFTNENEEYENIDEADDSWAKYMGENMLSDQIIFSGYRKFNELDKKTKTEIEYSWVRNEKGIVFLQAYGTFSAIYKDGSERIVYAIFFATIYKGRNYFLYNIGTGEENDNEAFTQMIHEISFDDTQSESAPKEDTSVIKITIDGERVIPDSDPVIVNDRTLCPIRAVAEKLGYEVLWDGPTRTATIRNEEREIKITVGGDKITGYRNAKDPVGLPIQLRINVNLDVPAQIINDRTYLPLRAVSEALRCLVDWDGTTRTVLIETAQYGEMVYKDAFIDTYHQPSCDMLKIQKEKGCTIEKEFLNELILAGYKPCSICN